MCDALARRYGVLPTAILELSPDDLAFVAACRDAGVAEMGQQVRQGDGPVFPAILVGEV